MLATSYAVQISTRTNSQLSAFYKLGFISKKKKKKKRERRTFNSQILSYRYRTNTDKIYPIRNL